MTAKTAAVLGSLAVLVAVIAAGNFGIMQVLLLWPLLPIAGLVWFALEVLGTLRRIEASVSAMREPEFDHVA